MGVITGNFIPNQNYKTYKQEIQSHCNKKGISNIDNFNYRVILSTGKEIFPEGRIGITDVNGFDEIEIEVCGIDSETIKEIVLCNKISPF